MTAMPSSYPTSEQARTILSNSKVEFIGSFL
jgi:hypothetical protein